MCNSDVFAIVLWLCNPVLLSLLFGCIVLGLYYVHVVCVAPIQSYMSPFCMSSLICVFMYNLSMIALHLYSWHCRPVSDPLGI